ncbi:NAD(P)H-hydrate dehydratase [Bacteroides sp. 519]|uniref:NAD(P)H-hydrate dehydratase n=1 Tax=Bacteroides sp. 519 TaxID=2302937 RepID=UPI0013D1A659|nr:NAD(P)H-hydrate dehydratase [Bacteroides sp. 519]NDV59164.1 NAD(P)H-hydrate dehydratase [Bacteroides sp. 519]
MKIFPTHIIKKLDEYTIQGEPISSIDLMERAARTFTEAVIEKWPKETPVTIFAGPGNNGGDALAIARMLSHKGYRVNVFLFNPHGTLSPDCQINKDLLTKTNVDFTEVSTQFAPPKLTEKHLVIDGLFGSGLNKPLAGGFAAVVKYINSCKCTVASIDIPSGLMGEDNDNNDKTAIIRANYTFCFQLPKLAFVLADNAEFVGEWQLLDININKGIIKETETDFDIIEKEEIQQLIKARGKFTHKGDFGHAMLIAGSYGMAGASVLAARSCLKSGVGLLTVHAPAINTNIIQCSAPEAMVDPDYHDHIFSSMIDTSDFDAVGIGPGLGKAEETGIAVLQQIRSCEGSMVIDADALNFLASHRQTLLSHLPKNSILTPHPGELERLVGKCKSSYSRLMNARELAHNAKVCIVLKGAYTAIITPDRRCSFNPTGNSGMATAGSGDVLTGIILALLAQGYKAEDAAKIGTYVHGMAGDIAKEKYSAIALTAGDIIECLPDAWKIVTSVKTF